MANPWEHHTHGNSNQANIILNNVTTYGTP